MSQSVFTAAAQVAFMIGHPVAHTALPSRINACAVAQGEDLMMVPLDIPPAGLAQWVDALRHGANVAGAVVTAPHKAAVPGLVDRVSARVRRIGRANLIWSENGVLHGDNTDGQGFVAALRGKGAAIAGLRCVMFGAGGAGAAIAAELAAEGAGAVDLVDTDATQADALAARLGGPVQPVPAPRDLSGYGLVVNATAVGLDGRGCVHDLTGLKAGAVVADVLATPEPTPFLKMARKKGASTQNGQDMAHAQVPIIARRFGWPQSIS